MFYARYYKPVYDSNWNVTSRQVITNIYYSWDQFHNDTFSPDTDGIYIINFVGIGGSYQERKYHIQDIAIEWSHADKNGLSWGEMATVENWLETYGRKYGLLQEFRENAII